MLLVFGFLAWAPYTKMAHVFTALLNLYTARLEPAGAALKPLDFDQAETLGVNSLAALTWKDLLDLDACTECGRCTAACPAHQAGKTLSPRDLILDLRRLSHEGGDVHRALPIIEATPALAAGGRCGLAPPVPPAWKRVRSFRLSSRCQRLSICMRRHLVMEQAEFPETLQEAVASLEARGHPFPGSRRSHGSTGWMGLPVPQPSLRMLRRR